MFRCCVCVCFFHLKLVVSLQEVFNLQWGTRDGGKQTFPENTDTVAHTHTHTTVSQQPGNNTTNTIATAGPLIRQD